MRTKRPVERERLEHILEANHAIFEFTKNMEEQEFESDHQIRSAVLYQFIIIGEAVSALSLDLTDRYPYPWHKPRAFRNFIAHEYYGIKIWIIWNAIHEQLPDLKALVERILKETS